MFIHRDGVSGNTLNFDVSKDGGTSWTLDRGPLYFSSSARPRYPQGALVNPSGVLNADSAFVSFLAPLTTDSFWTGTVNGQQQVVNTSVVSNEVDTLNAFNHNIPSGYTVTPQGVIWSIDAEYVNGSYNNLLVISKGVWNSTTRKFDYANQVLPAPVSNAGGEARLLGCNIAFAPNGQNGYVVMCGNDGSISDSIYYPIVFFTSDGGVTWSSPSNIGLNVDPYFGFGSPFYTMGPQFDIAVDASGSLHILCEILEGDNHWNSNSAYNHFGIFDISSFNGAQWKAQLIVKPETYLGDFGTPGSTTDPEVFEYNRPQISLDGTASKIFFTWIDTDTIIFGTGYNNYPDFRVKGYDLGTQLWTNEINFTEFSGTSADGNSIFNTVSQYCFTNGATYTIPLTVTMMFASTGQPVNYYYIDGINITDADFTIPGNAIILPGGVSGAHTYISGKVYYDANGNGVMDGGDVALPQQTINVQPDGFTLFTNSNGDYFFYTYNQGISHVITTVPPVSFTISSDSASYTVMDDTVNQSGFDFGINGIVATNDLEVNIAGGVARCGFPVNYWITYENTGTTILDGRIEFVIDSATTFLSSVPGPDMISGDTLFYNFSNLYPFTSNQISVSLHMPLQAGDTLHFAVLAQFDSSGTFYTLGENPLTQIVTCSYDPNDKTVNPEGAFANHYTLFNDTLLYTVRFQNTGNDTAFTVVLRDTLSPLLDLNTFHITGSSHEVNATIYPNRMVEFRFDNILLPDSGTDLEGSNGFVQYRIQPLASITLPAEVSNTAYIYFDYNPPVQTNSVTNTLVTDIYIGVPQVDYLGESIQIVPNPFHNESEIILGAAFAEKESQLRVMNVWGELVINQTLHSKKEKIIRGNLSPGIYFYEVQNNEGKRAAGRFVIQ